MKWFQLPLGPLQTNAYIVKHTNKECVIVDPGGEGDKIIEWINKENLKPQAIVLTHAHFDHIGGVDEVRDEWNIPVYIHEKEKEWLTTTKYNGSKKFGMSITARPADIIIDKEQQIKIGPFTFQILETPGHSPGSVSYFIKELGAVFSGDALFAGSIGRTDLYGGYYDVLIDSIHKKLLTLPQKTIVAPGHGPETTIQQEMDRNPFLNGF